MFNYELYDPDFYNVRYCTDGDEYEDIIEERKIKFKEEYLRLLNSGLSVYEVEMVLLKRREVNIFEKLSKTQIREMNYKKNQHELSRMCRYTKGTYYGRV